MIKLSPNTKFSYTIAKGSIKSRIKLAEDFNKKIFDSYGDLCN